VLCCAALDSTHSKQTRDIPLCVFFTVRLLYETQLWFVKTRFGQQSD
jgi:hypothetical protein